MNHITGPDRPYEKCQAPLRRILEKVLECYSDFTQIVSMTNFMPLLDLFQGDSRTDIATAVLDAFVKTPGTTADPVVISTVSGRPRAPPAWPHPGLNKHVADGRACENPAQLDRRTLPRRRSTSCR